MCSREASLRKQLKRWASLHKSRDLSSRWGHPCRLPLRTWLSWEEGTLGWWSWCAPLFGGSTWPGRAPTQPQPLHLTRRCSGKIHGSRNRPVLSNMHEIKVFIISNGQRPVGVKSQDTRVNKGVIKNPALNHCCSQWREWCLQYITRLIRKKQVPV